MVATNGSLLFWEPGHVCVGGDSPTTFRNEANPYRLGHADEVRVYIEELDHAFAVGKFKFGYSCIFVFV